MAHPNTARCPSPTPRDARSRSRRAAHGGRGRSTRSTPPAPATSPPTSAGAVPVGIGDEQPRRARDRQGWLGDPRRRGRGATSPTPRGRGSSRRRTPRTRCAGPCPTATAPTAAGAAPPTPRPTSPPPPTRARSGRSPNTTGTGTGPPPGPCTPLAVVALEDGQCTRPEVGGITRAPARHTLTLPGSPRQHVAAIIGAIIDDFAGTLERAHEHQRAASTGLLPCAPGLRPGAGRRVPRVVHGVLGPGRGARPQGRDRARAVPPRAGVVTRHRRHLRTARLHPPTRQRRGRGDPRNTPGPRARPPPLPRPPGRAHRQRRARGTGTPSNARSTSLSDVREELLQRLIALSGQIVEATERYQGYAPGMAPRAPAEVKLFDAEAIDDEPSAPSGGRARPSTSRGAIPRLSRSGSPRPAHRPSTKSWSSERYQMRRSCAPSRRRRSCS